MAHAGQVLKIGPVTLTIRRCDAEVLDMVALYPPGGPTSPEHFHPTQSERFEVLEGTLEVSVEGQHFTLEATQTLEVQPLQRHLVWNESDREVRVRWETWPAQRTAEFYETLAELTDLGGPMHSAPPNLLQTAVLLAEYDGEIRLARPPRPIQKLWTGLVAPLGWLAGYRSRPHGEGHPTTAKGAQ